MSRQDPYAEFKTSATQPSERLMDPYADFQAPFKKSEAPPTLMDRVLNTVKAETPSPVIGAAKGVGSTLFGAKQMIDRVVGGTVDPRPEFLKPQGIGEHIGYGVEQIAEFAIPGAVVSKIPRVASLLAKGGKTALATEAAVQGVTAGAVSTVQSGGDTKQAALDSAIAASMTGAFGALAPVFKRAGSRVMTAAIQPSRTDILQGFDAENIFKYKLQGGNLAAVAKRTKAKLDDLTSQLRTAVQQHGDVESDALQMLSDAVDDVRAAGAKNFGKLSDLKAAETRFINELNLLTEYGVIRPDGKIGLVEAQKLKQAVGELGAWSEGQTDLESKAIELLANAYYSRIQKAVEAGAPQVKAINRQLSELIPISDAIIRKLPLDEKKRLLELSDLIILTGGAGATSTSGLMMLSRMTHTTRGGSALRFIGEKASTIGKGIGSTGAAVTPLPWVSH